MDNKLVYLIVGLIILGSLLTVLFIYLIVHRLIQKRTKAKIEQIKEKFLEPIYLHFIEENPLPRCLIPTNTLQMIAVEELLSGFTKSLRGEALLLKVNQFVKQHLMKRYEKQLRSLRWSYRMNALYKVEEFALDDLLGQITKMITSNKKYSKVEYFQMYKLIITFHNKDFLNYLLQAKIELGEMDYKHLIYIMDEKQMEECIHHYDYLPPSFQKSVIDLIGIKHLGGFVDFLEERLTEGEPEIRIRALKAISELGLMRNIPLFLSFSRSNHWEERMMLAKLLIHVSPTTAFTYLGELIKDSSWWVRSQAAQTILYHRKGKELLERIITSSDDHFAIDMAKEALGEG